MRFRLSSGIVIPATALSCGFASAAPAPDRADSWATHAGGVERAGQVIDECLARVERATGESANSCVWAAYQACEVERGTSQRDLNACSRFSYDAWTARIARTIDRFMSARSARTRLGPKTDEAKQQLLQSQQRWSEWSTLDCDFQAKGTEGGSIRPFTISICLSNHAASRSIELQGLIAWWLNE